MNTENKSLNLSSLLGALSAPKNLTAVGLLAATFITTALLMGLFTAIGASLLSNGHYDTAKALGLLGSLFAVATLLYGMNAVGLVLMAEARKSAPLSFRDAILISLATGHRLIGLVLVNFALLLLAVLAVIIVLFICKIPGLGAFLYTFVYPIAALFLGLIWVGQALVIVPLAAPAIWDGHGVFAAMSRLYTLVRSKLAEVLMLELVLFLMLMVVGGLITAVITTGIGITSSLSFAVLEMGGGRSGLDALSMMMMGHMGGGDGYFTAYSLGSALLIGVAAIIPALISTKGFALIFVQVSEGVDFAADEAMLKAHKETAQRKMQEAQEEARRKREQFQAHAAATATPAVSAVIPAPAASCPQCKAPVAADDTFCGECGHRLG